MDLWKSGLTGQHLRVQDLGRGPELSVSVSGAPGPQSILHGPLMATGTGAGGWLLPKLAALSPLRMRTRPLAPPITVLQ